MAVTDYYVTTDAMGSVMAVLDETGNVLERRSYDAFGEATYMLPDGTVVPDSPTGVDIGFQGQLMDKLTGMYQMGYRWYSPVLGRWVSRDPIGLEGGINVAAFVGNCPIILSDSYGLLTAKLSIGLYARGTNSLIGEELEKEINIPTNVSDYAICKVKKAAEDVAEKLMKPVADKMKSLFVSTVEKFFGIRMTSKGIEYIAQSILLSDVGGFAYSKLKFSAHGEVTCNCRVDVELTQISSFDGGATYPSKIDGYPGFDLGSGRGRIALVYSTMKAVGTLSESAMREIASQVKKC